MINKKEALDELFRIFHKTRLTNNVSVPSHIVRVILKEEGYYSTRNEITNALGELKHL